MIILSKHPIQESFWGTHDEVWRAGMQLAPLSTGTRMFTLVQNTSRERRLKLSLFPEIGFDEQFGVKALNMRIGVRVYDEGTALRLYQDDGVAITGRSLSKPDTLNVTAFHSDGMLAVSTSNPQLISSKNMCVDILSRISIERLNALTR